MPSFESVELETRRIGHPMMVSNRRTTYRSAFST